MRDWLELINREIIMANDKKRIRLTTSNSTNGNKPPIFKPGDKFYTEFGKEILNGSVVWNEVVQAILDTGYGKEQLALDVGLKRMAINRVLAGEYQDIYFRAGARILMIHCRLFPHLYGF